MKDGYKGVTLEQIMHHRGGIPAELNMTREKIEGIVAGETDPRKMRLNYAKYIMGQEMPAKPGEKFIYSNGGFELLSVIAERASGETYEQLVKETIFEPLHLSHSYTSADKLPYARPSGHVRGPSGLEVANFSGPIEILFAGAGGGMFMSVGDLAHYAQAHMDGFNGKDGILKAETFKHLQQGIAEEPGGRLYACGWGIEDFPGLQTMHTHNGSNGTMRAQVAFFPESKLVIAAFCNAGGESEPSPPLQAVLAIAGRYAAKNRVQLSR